MSRAAHEHWVPVSNDEIADTLDQVAGLLEAQDANPFRVRAYRRAAAAIRGQARGLVEVYRKGGIDALDALPTIGRTIASHVAELAVTGHLTLLERLQGEVSPERLFATVAGIGPELARRVHEALGAETLEELEVAAHDGRLAEVPGFGPRRIRAVRAQLASLLGRASRQRASGAERRSGARPAASTLLAVDAEYREQAAAGRLRRVTPRRFNPRHEAWLPVLHSDRDGWHVTALYSNTARAHELGRTRDWVVLYYDRDGDAGQCTVVTETSGPLRGQRVVRGREAECARAEGGRSPGDGARTGPRAHA